MLRYLQIQNKQVFPQSFVISFQGEAYFPRFIHAAIDQDRPIGDPYTFEDHKHDIYHINLYANNPGAYRKNGVKYEVHPGSLVIISPGELHNLFDKEQPNIYSEITFAFTTMSGKILTLPFADLLNVYSGVRGRLQPCPVLSKETAKELTMILIQIMDYLQSPSVLSDFYAYRSLSQVFDLILTHCFSENLSGQEQACDEGILRVRRFIDEHYTESITAESLAKLSHCSKGHLFKAFKKAFQISPLAYQQALRFEAAKRLLRFTSLSCYTIAQRVGYNNINYFHRQFKKRTGQTPQQYRQSIRKTIEINS